MVGGVAVLTTCAARGSGARGWQLRQAEQARLEQQRRRRRPGLGITRLRERTVES